MSLLSQMLGLDTSDIADSEHFTLNAASKMFLRKECLSRSACVFRGLILGL